jgi:hypothetical protein
MAKDCKVSKWKLDNEVLQLNQEGMSNVAIAHHINKEYSDIEDLRNISHMSIGRFLQSNRESETLNKLDMVKDPGKFIEEEFNSKIRQNIQDAEQMNNLVNEFTIKLKSGKEISSVELNRIVNSWKKTNDQIRMNLVSLRQFADSNIIKPTQNIIYKKEINIKNLLLGVSRGLCPVCKKRIEEELEEYNKA